MTQRLTTRTLPGTEVQITEMALGTAPFATGFWGNTAERGVATAVAAIDHGIELFDTAPLYGIGEAESGSALRSPAAPTLPAR